MRTISGKEPSVTVAFRLPMTAYNEALRIVKRRHLTKLSQVLRPAVLAGLEAMAAANGQQQKTNQEASHDT